MAPPPACETSSSSSSIAGAPLAMRRRRMMMMMSNNNSNNINININISHDDDDDDASSYSSFLPPPLPTPPPPPPPPPHHFVTSSSSSDDPVFEYINNILMDENWDDDLHYPPRSPLQQNFLHIFNGFHAILGDSSDAQSAAALLHGDGDSAAPTTTTTTFSQFPVGGVSSSSNSAPADHASLHSMSGAATLDMARRDIRDEDLPIESQLLTDPCRISTTYVLPRDRRIPAAPHPITIVTTSSDRTIHMEHVRRTIHPANNRSLGSSTDGSAAGRNVDDAVQLAADARGDHHKDDTTMMIEMETERSRWRPNGRRYPWENRKGNERGGGNSGGGGGRSRAGSFGRGGGAMESDEGDDNMCFVENGDLRAEVDAQLHSEGWTASSYAGSLRLLRAAGDREAAAAASQNGGGGRRGGVMVDLMALLIKCARAVAEGKVKKAEELLQEMEDRGGASAEGGSGLQRAAFYVGEALRARISGTGGSLLMYYDTAWWNNNRTNNHNHNHNHNVMMMMNKPAAAISSMMHAHLRAYKRIECEAWPYAKLGNYFANQRILETAKDAPRLHIIDYGISYGFQWPCLISALASRKGGPPRLRMTGIDLPSSPLGRSPTEAVERTGLRLAEYAKAYGVPFEYEGVAAAAWEDVRLQEKARRRPGEVLAINCMFRLRHLMDEVATSGGGAADDFGAASAAAASSDGCTSLCPRDAVLAEMRSLEPDVMVVGIVNAAHSSPFFLPRFREALYYYASCFDALAQSAAPEAEEERRLVEKERLGKEVMNVVACEGMERVERPEVYKKWQARLERTGFRGMVIKPAVLEKTAALLAALQYHKEFSASADDSRRWLLLGWKGRPTHALSSWRQ